MTKKLILYSHDGKLGDAVLMTGLVESLSRAGFLIYVTASRSNLAFWQADSRLAGVVEVPKTGLLGKLAAIAKLRRVSADYLFSWDLHRSSTGTLLARLSGARRKVGFWPEGHGVFDVILEFDPACEHITRKYQRAAELIGIARLLPVPCLGFPVVANELDAYAGYSKRVFVNFFGATQDRSFTAEVIPTVLERLSHEFPSCAFLVCHMEHQPWVMNSTVGFDNIDAIRTDANWKDLYSAIQACDAVITVDTSIAHIAAAMRKPLLEIFCMDSPSLVRFRPVGESVVIVESASPEVISKIDLDELVSALRELFAMN